MSLPIQRRKRTIKSPKKQGTVKRVDVERVVRRIWKRRDRCGLSDFSRNQNS